MQPESKQKPEMESRKRGAVRNAVATPHVPETADVVTETPEPMTLGKLTKRETKVHRKRALRNKVQKAK
jgi:hypothetical protein